MEKFEVFLISVRDRGLRDLRPTGVWYHSHEEQLAAADRLLRSGRYDSVVTHRAIKCEGPGHEVDPDRAGELV